MKQAIVHCNTAIEVENGLGSMPTLKQKKVGKKAS